MTGGGSYLIADAPREAFFEPKPMAPADSPPGVDKNPVGGSVLSAASPQSKTNHPLPVNSSTSTRKSQLTQASAKPSLRRVGGTAGSLETKEAPKLVMSPSNVLTMTGGSIDTPNYRVVALVSASNNAKLSEPQVTGSRADIGIVVLPTKQGESYLTDFNPQWNIIAQRVHPKSSGVSYFTLTSHDQAGNVYTGILTIKWLPIPYYSLASGRVEIVTGSSPQWGTLTGLVVHATMQPSSNFGQQKLSLSLSLPDYPCTGTPTLVPDKYLSTVQYSGDNDLAMACWFYIGQVDEIRKHPSIARILVQANGLFTDFSGQVVDVTVPAW